tara:strand:+ start:28430 stop:30871 length:2442 start_codon:yes stop_codon:yes gene_type:complete
MAYNVTETFRNLADQIDKEPVLILKIKGSQYLYGSAPIVETARWDDPRIKWDNTEGITWDGEIEREDSKPYIMLNRSQTTKQIAQQLMVDKGGSGSVSIMALELVDYRGEVAEDLSFNQIGDPLGAEAEIFLGFVGCRYPQDFISVIKGYVDDLTYNAGSITVSVSLATNLIRNASFEKYQAILSSAIDSTQTNIPVDTVEPFLETQDSLTSYIQIEDEIMEVIAKNANSFTVIRSRLNTLPAAHDIETEVGSRYRLQGSPIDLILKLLHSKNGNAASTTDYIIRSLNRVSSTQVITNSIVIDDPNIQARLGLVPGDLIPLVGTGSNDGIKTALSFGVLDTGRSYIIVEETLTEETGLSLDLQVKSKYNLLPDGAGLNIDYVDTEEFENIQDLYSASLKDYDFKNITETIENTRDFIIKEICRPMGLYLINRKAKTSGKYTAPPFSVEATPVLNTKNLEKLTKVQSKRSTHKYLYNSIIFRYSPDILTGEYLDKNISLNADSFSRIPVGRKRLSVDSMGLDRSSESVQVVQRVSARILNRYKFGARYIKGIKTLYSTGVTLEIGDIVFFGGEDTQLVNLETGARDLPAAQYEIINKKLGLDSIELELLETGFGIDGIFGTFSPGSILAEGSTASKLLLGDLWASDQYDKERDKWNRWVGLKIRVRSDDYTYDEITTLKALDNVTNNGLTLDPPLPSAPLAGYYVELAKYTDYTDEELDLIVKLTHTFTMPSSLLTAVADNKTFDIDPTEIANYTVGMQINVHAEDYTLDSDLRIIDDITGNTITLDEDLDISPAVGHRLEVYSYSDAKGYRYL